MKPQNWKLFRNASPVWKSEWELFVISVGLGEGGVAQSRSIPRAKGDYWYPYKSNNLFTKQDQVEKWLRIVVDTYCEVMSTTCT